MKTGTDAQQHYQAKLSIQMPAHGLQISITCWPADSAACCPLFELVSAASPACTSTTQCYHSRSSAPAAREAVYTDGKRSWGFDDPSRLSLLLLPFQVE